MAERLRLRISRVIPSFRSCRCKDDAAASAADSPVFRASLPNPVASTHMEAAPCPGELRRRHVPVVPTPAGCSCDSEDLAEDPPQAYLWRKEEKWHVVARVGPSSPRRKIDSDGAGARELFPPLPVRRRPRRTRAAGKKKGAKTTRSKPRVSTSSADSHWFSSEDEEEYMEDYDYGDETEVLMSSSRSFSTYYSSSPEQNPRLKAIRESPTDHHKVAPPLRAAARRGLSRTKCPSPEELSSPVAARRSSSSVSSVLRKLMMTPLCGAALEGKVKESFAVVKRSEDPYNDFRRSMVEMVVENQMSEEGDLEQLLHCFLLLNSHHHHPAIVLAFSDVWATLFPFSHSCTSDVGSLLPQQSSPEVNPRA
ncbi:hypothetical protein Taro_015504 [Colocasia esculenta]|uniref:Transcription repressor n=1 Tax=Colocasia esculenta TaxID=4460 RepID=A0A843UMB5_COLES|nr:hypothetical protein [Colocasia esculenta]